MTKFYRPLFAVIGAVIVSAALASAPPPAATVELPLWAYGFVTPAAPGEKATLPGPPTHALRPNEDAGEQKRPRHIAGSTGEFSLLEIRNGHDVVDWFPGDHPPLTPIMKNGPASLGEKAFACAFCHMPNGKGRPENAPVAGLPAAYFIRQMQDMKHGLRASAEPRKANTLLMIALAQAMTDEEIKEAADYFATLPPTPWIRVVETARVPRSKIVTNMFVPVETEPTEPLAGRIMEMPENADATELLRDPRSGFIAYVPIGSVKKGEALVATGGATVVDGKPVPGKTVACATCHGPDLNGVAEIPGIAGRSPSYIARQLYDIQQGTRKSPLSQLMQPAVANLSAEDLVAIAAYVASLRPAKP
ncbi:MAG: c-type cytochrome [Undibacterium sp.]|nr:c-type cytochrome [Opitutaceae bacterium]